MPGKIQDENAALGQFKVEFTKRYCQHLVGPKFSTNIFEEVVNDAFGGPAQTKKSLGNLLYFIL